jgi:hypothetical protein
MRTDLVRITRDIPLEDLKTGKVSPVDAYEVQVRHWIVGPGRRLSTLYPDETDHGMALLALELMFFEPHGRLLSTEPLAQESNRLFCRGFDRFREYLRRGGFIDDDTNGLASASFYKWARCGLFHYSLLADELLVDAVGYSGRCLARNPVLDGWLVNPWLLLDALEEYVAAYTQALRSEPESELRKNFDAAFGVLVQKPLERIVAKMSPNRVGGGVSPPPPTPPGMRVRTGRFTEDEPTRSRGL